MVSAASALKEGDVIPYEITIYIAVNVGIFSYFCKSKHIGMGTKEAIKLFEEKRVRTAWDDEQEKWYFSIVDVVDVLTDSKDALTARKYWDKLKQRLKEEGNETVTNCHQFKMRALDGKMRLTIE